jgi:UDP-2-acetamido-3-amino-2,3-dideoxy-glucuronate N-acetyltransferase
VSRRALIAPSARLYGPVIVGDFAFLDAGVTVGYPSPNEQAVLKARMMTSGKAGFAASFDHLLDTCVNAPTYVGAHSILRSGTTIYSGSVLLESVDIAHNAQLRENCRLGRGTRVLTGAQLMAFVNVGHGCRIAGTLCSRSQVGHGTSMLGHLTHRYRMPVSGQNEPSPRMGDGVVVGRESAIVGDVDIGDFAIVGAGAVVTRSVPSGTLWAHNPAIQIGLRSEEEIEQLEQAVAAAKDRRP